MCIAVFDLDRTNGVAVANDPHNIPACSLCQQSNQRGFDARMCCSIWFKLYTAGKQLNN
jgi:hypothetical protein